MFVGFLGVGSQVLSVRLVEGCLFVVGRYLEELILCRHGQLAWCVCQRHLWLGLVFLRLVQCWLVVCGCGCCIPSTHHGCGAVVCCGLVSCDLVGDLLLSEWCCGGGIRCSGCGGAPACICGAAVVAAAVVAFWSGLPSAHHGCAVCCAVVLALLFVAWVGLLLLVGQLPVVESLGCLCG